MGIWEILGIDCTKEVSAIKKAYAKKLKIHHPEEDPEGFQKLREAYDKALDYAKTVDSEEDETEEENLNFEFHGTLKDGLLNSKEHELGNDIFSSSEEDNLNEEDKRIINVFFSKLEKVYINFFQRIDTKSWEELLNDEIMWRLDLREAVYEKMLEFLMEHYIIPQSVWRLINSNFQWDKDKERLSYYCPDGFICYLMKQIGKNKTLGYSYFNKDIKIDYGKYVFLREKAYISILYSKFKKAEEYLDEAEKIYDKDPDLLCMIGECYLRKGKLKEATAKFNDAVKINPNDGDICSFQAQIYYNCGEYIKGLNTCKIVKSVFKMDEINIIMGRCYLGMLNYPKATQVFTAILKADPNNDEVKKHLEKICGILEEAIKIKPFSFIKRRLLKDIYSAFGCEEKSKDIGLKSTDVLQLIGKVILICFLTLLLIVLSIFTGGIAFLLFMIYVVAKVYSIIEKRKIAIRKERFGK